MIRKVSAPDFDLAKIPPRERVLAETVTALLGKGAVRAEETSEGETAATGEAPGIAGPEPAGEPEQSLPPTADQLADQAMDGLLTVGQLQNLPVDPDISGINNDLTDPAFFNRMKANLEASLAAAAKGQPGISRNDLPLIVLDALRRTAYCLEGNPPDQLVTFDDFKAFVDKAYAPALATNPADPEATQAKRFLAVAEIANQLMKG